MGIGDQNIEGFCKFWRLLCLGFAGAALGDKLDLELIIGQAREDLIG